MPSELASKAIELISPSLGEFIARAKVKAACNLAGLDVETLSQHQLRLFAEQFELTCATSLGKEAGRNMKEKLLSLSPS